MVSSKKAGFFLCLLIISILTGINWSILRDFKDPLLINYLGVEAFIFLKTLIGPSIFYGLSVIGIEILLIAACFIFSPRWFVKVSYGAFLALALLFGFGFLGIQNASTKEFIVLSFYGFASIWMVFSIVLFWGYANYTCKFSEASKFYYFFSFLTLLVPWLISLFSSKLIGIQSVYIIEHPQIIMGVLFIIGLLILALFFLADQQIQGEVSVEKDRPNSKEYETPYIVPYVIGLILLTLCYGVGTNFMEVMWKNIIKLAYPHPADYSAYMANVSTMFGVATLVISAGFLLIILWAFGKIRWMHAALVTPVILLVFGGSFFLTSLLGLDFGIGLPFVALLGQYATLLSKVFYTLLVIPTTMLAYFPLSKGLRFGILALSAFFVGFGKTIGSLTLQLMIALSGTLEKIQGRVALLFVILMVIWILTIILMANVINRQKAEG